MRKIILILLAIGVIGAGIGYYMVNKPVPSLEKKKADLEVTAAKLLTDYQLNETAANETYLGKLVLVSGKVVDITQENGIKPQPYVIDYMRIGNRDGNRRIKTRRRSKNKRVVYRISEYRRHGGCHPGAIHAC